MKNNGPRPGKRVVVTGATGNVGTSVVRALAADPDIGSVLGLARRRPGLQIPNVEWDTVDLSRTDSEDRLVGLLRGADAVVHLAWRFQPTHDPVVTWQSNVLGSRRVFEAVARGGVPALVHASSVGAYSPGPKDEPGVDEEWPTDGWPDAAYCREKAYLERVLDTFELRHPQIRVVRMRPGFLFKETAAPQQRRIFVGRYAPGPLLRPDLLPFIPDLDGLRFQVLHTDDAADAYRLAVLRDVRGPFNLAADPVIDARGLADLLDARIVRIPRALARTALSAAWRAHAVPASPHPVRRGATPARTGPRPCPRRTGLAAHPYRGRRTERLSARGSYWAGRGHRTAGRPEGRLIHPATPPAKIPRIGRPGLQTPDTTGAGVPVRPRTAQEGSPCRAVNSRRTPISFNPAPTSPDFPPGRTRHIPAGPAPRTRHRTDYGKESHRGSGMLDGRKTVITGGDSGIGRAVAVAFAREGADVLLIHLPEEEQEARRQSAWWGRPGAGRYPSSATSGTRSSAAPSRSPPWPSSATRTARARSAPNMVEGPNDIVFSPAPGAVTYWVGEAMQGTDYQDLDETPDAVVSTTKALAANATPLARLLVDSSCPAA